MGVVLHIASVDGDDNKIAIAISFHGNKRW